MAKLERSKKRADSSSDNTKRKASSRHPEGEHGPRASSSRSSKSDHKESESDLSSTEIESFSEDEPAKVQSDVEQEQKDANPDVPLSVDNETKVQLRLLQKIRKPADIMERIAQWVADKFMFSSQYVLDMLQGDAPWPGWSRAQLFCPQ